MKNPFLISDGRLSRTCPFLIWLYRTIRCPAKGNTGPLSKDKADGLLQS